MKTTLLHKVWAWVTKPRYSLLVVVLVSAFTEAIAVGYVIYTLNQHPSTEALVVQEQDIMNTDLVCFARGVLVE